MAILRIECPECGAGLKSAKGFQPGQSVVCPKCEVGFSVEEPEPEEEAKPGRKPVKAAVSRHDDEDEHEDEAPRKKKKKKRSRDADDEEEKSYKNSPMRYAILGVLVAVMIVLGVMLYLKKKRESDANTAQAAPATGNSTTNPAPPPMPPPFNAGGPGGPPRGVPGGPPGGGPGRPGFPGGVPGAPGFPNNGLPPRKSPQRSPNTIGEVFGGASESTAEGKKIIADLSAKLVGKWEGKLGDTAYKVTYESKGAFSQETEKGNNRNNLSGTWEVAKLIGNKGLKLRRGAKTISVVFEDDELLHDSELPGETVVLRKAR